MPYISKSIRDDLTPDSRLDPLSPGELNFQITKLIHNYISINGESYQHYNDILGALEGAKFEVYRRRISNYEDEAIERNGDV